MSTNGGLSDAEFVRLAQRFELEMLARTLHLARLPAREFSKVVDSATERMLRYARPALNRGNLVEVNVSPGTDFLAAVQQVWSDDSAAPVIDAAPVGVRVHGRAIDDAACQVEALNAVMTRGLPLWDSRQSEAQHVPIDDVDVDWW